MSLIGLYFLGVVLTYITMVYRGHKGSNILSQALQWPVTAIRLLPSFLEFARYKITGTFRNLRAMGTLGTIIIIMIVLTLLTKGAFLKYVIGFIGFIVLIGLIIVAIVIYRLRRSGRRF